MSLNLDQNELAKFSSRADAWWDPQGDFKTLHDINPVRLQFIEQRYSINNRSVLDVGCGGGLLAEAMANSGGIVTAIDASAENIKAASNHANSQGLGVDYQCCTVEELAKEESKKYHIVTCMELLEHVPDPVSLINACTSLVAPGGHIFFSTLNRHPKSYLMAVLGAEYLLNLIPRGTHNYEKFIKPSELVKWCRGSGLQINELCGLHYNPLLNACRLVANPDVNYLLDTQLPDIDD